MSLPSLNTRLSLLQPSHPTPALGTIRFTGPVEGTSGQWLGVEWDDPARGKHDGVHEKSGKRYFACRIKRAGSFLRPNAPGISYGVPFYQALRNKYQPSEEDAGQSESQFFTTSFAKPIEVVPLARVGERFRRLDKLREAGLEWEGVNGAGEEVRNGEAQLTSLEVLNLSYSLIPSFEAVDGILRELPSLKTLSLNSNRFVAIQPSQPLLPNLSKLTELQLNNTFLSWAELLHLSPSLPSLQHLQLGRNHLTNLDSPSYSPLSSTPLFPKLHTLNLAENDLTSWTDVVESLKILPALTTLILSSNKLSFPPSSSSTSRTKLQQLRHLHLTNNLLASWTEVDELMKEVPNLEGLRIGENPFCDGEDEVSTRLCLIARVESLTSLEGSTITAGEREDAEIFYLSQINKETGSEEEKIGRHARWKALLRKYGQPPIEKSKERDTIRSKLICLTLHVPSLPASQISVLPSQPTRLLRNHFTKVFKKPFPKTKWKMVAILKNENGKELRVEIMGEEEGREVSVWGLQDGDGVVMEELR